MVCAAESTNTTLPVTFKTYADAFHGFFNFPDGEPKRALRQDILGFLGETDAYSAADPAA